MKVISRHAFDDVALRTIRAAHGRAGRATRRECLTFIDRAVTDALKRAPDPKPARTKRPKPAATFIVESPEQVDDVRAVRARIAGLYKR